MSIDDWFSLTMFLGIYLAGLLLLDGAHRGHANDLRRAHRHQADGLRSYIRTLVRERKWLEAELAYTKLKLAKAEREQVQPEPEHIWMPSYDEEQDALRTDGDEGEWR